MDTHSLKIINAHENNLKHLNLEIEHDTLTVVTGLSGSGKSSLAFDTVFAEGQRRFIETFSPYTRQFLDKIKKPDVDMLKNVRAAIAIQQRTKVTSSRSTVGSMTDIIDYLKILWANLAKPYCLECGIELEGKSSADLTELLCKWQKLKPESTFYICTPFLSSDKKQFKKEVERLITLGFSRCIDVASADILHLEDLNDLNLKANGNNFLLLLDRIRPNNFSAKQVQDSLEQAFGIAHGTVVIAEIVQNYRPFLRIVNNKAQKNLDKSPLETHYFYNHPRCTEGEVVLPNAQPSLFSYNHPNGSCAKCQGFGKILTVDPLKCVPDHNLTIEEGAVQCWSTPSTRRYYLKLLTFCKENGISTKVAWKDLAQHERDLIFDAKSKSYLGLRTWFKKVERKSYKMHVRVFLARYRTEMICPSCNGTRLRREALAYRINGVCISDLWSLSIEKLLIWLKNLHSTYLQTTSSDVLSRAGDSRYLNDVFEGVISRVSLLSKLGLSYLTLDRQARTLSGGETQRVNLVTALGSHLTSTQFVLDEPSVGLHPHDTDRLLDSIRELQRRGNSVLLVEHDPDCIAAADNIIELGPEGGEKGGEVVYCGSASEWSSSIGELLHFQKKITPFEKTLKIKGASARNLKDIDLEIPLQAFVCISGVSGSGKSTLVQEVIKYEYEALQNGLPSFTKVEGFEGIDRLFLVDQSALTKAPRANIATYCKIWETIRSVLAATEDAQIRKLSKSAFSFNVDGGRCPACKGAGFVREDMQFLSDVYLPCESCLGKRFKEIVLEVQYKGKNVDDFLQMTVSTCKEFFKEDFAIWQTCEMLETLGLGHLSLGHPLSELSGGEAQRLKLIPFLQKTDQSHSLLIFDEPTTGLHNKDVSRLIELFYTLRDRGHSLLVVEHNLSLISAADWIIDLGPAAGEHGGEVVRVGTPLDFVQDEEPPSLTAQHLRRFYNDHNNTDCNESHCKKSKALKKVKQKFEAPAFIGIRGAKEHNLQNIDIDIPLNKIVALCGVSGSGKSSIAKDILYAEGQRRYLDCLSPYARQFIKELKRPDVSSISNILPTVCVYQHTFQPSRLSTIASMSEAYNYLRLLYAKTALQYCPDHPDRRISPLEAEDIAREVMGYKDRIKVLAPVIKQKKGAHRGVLERAVAIDLNEVRVDNVFVKASSVVDDLSKTKPHTIEYVVGSFDPKKIPFEVIRECVTQALSLGNGTLIVYDGKDTIYSTERTCPICKRGFFKADPEDLSFNSKRGVCPTCGGYGQDEHGNVCKSCNGARINSVAANLRLGEKNIHQACLLTPSKLKAFLSDFQFNAAATLIKENILRELFAKLDALISLGLDYLTLDRDCSTLSSGELQRLRLATAMGSPLSGVLYIFDEPSAGLHPYDNRKVLKEMQRLKDNGNSVIVIEHDEESILTADHVIDVGPEAGRNGGKIVESLPLAQFIKSKKSITAAALRGEIVPECEVTADKKEKPVLTISNGNKNNIHDLNLTFPLESFVTIAGVSGAGKSSLVNGIVKEVLENGASSADRSRFKYGDTVITLGSALERIVTVDQKPIGANPRSTPASYLGILNEIRRLFAKTIEAQARGWDASFFSYNTGKGRCKTCEGRGDIKLKMSFLADATIECEDCHGDRFSEEVKSVRFLERNIVDVLKMTLEEASVLFANHYKINHILHTACEIGLGYLSLGQSSVTLSGGESQRLKLVSELSKRRKGRVLYILDEPTTGLHRFDVGRLIKILRRLTAQGHSVLVIEHDRDFILGCDHLVELGLGSGESGGKVIFNGDPAEISQSKTPWGEIITAYGGVF
ncbi:MAG: excinuclease ABC subunit UvrA [Bdellovibrionota bacterium]